MKKSLLLSAALMLTASSVMAQDYNGNRMLVHAKDGTVTAFNVANLDEVTFEWVEPSVVPLTVERAGGTYIAVSGVLDEAGADKFAVAYYTANATITDLADFVQKNAVATLEIGETCVIEGLVPETDYVIASLAYDQYGMPLGTATVNARTTAAEGDLFTIEVNNITWCNADITYIPADPNMTYYGSWLRKEKVVNEIGGVDKIADFDYAWWENLAEYYGGEVSEFVGYDVSQGVKNISGTSMEMKKWGTEVLCYAYGTNANGRRITPMVVKEFTTSSPVPSDNEFSVTINQVYSDHVDATITTKNDDTYFVSIQPTLTYVDTFANDDDLSFVLLQYFYSEPKAFHNGDWTIGEGDFFLKANRDYTIVVFGFNEGRSTPVLKVPFKTSAAE